MTVPTPADFSITACILAGGRGRRLGGADKGLVPLAGTPLIAHCIARIAPQVGRVMINANRNSEAYAAFGLEIFPDSGPDSLGPLSGVLSALRAVSTTHVLTLPCDSPFIPDDLASRLAQPLRHSGATLSVARADDRIQPVFALLPASLAGPLACYLDVGGRRIEPWLREQQACEVDFGTESFRFMNINTPEDLATAQTLLERGDAQTPPAR